MTPALDATHDPQRRSWVASAQAEDCDFPVQNLPFGRFHTADDTAVRVGIAIGDAVLDLRAVDALCRAGRLAGHAVETRFWEIGGHAGLAELEAAIASGAVPAP